MSEHTPTPWEIIEWDIDADMRRINIAEQGWVKIGSKAGIAIPEMPVDDAEGRATAEFIVRACNSHADLLAACKALADATERHLLEGDASIVELCELIVSARTTISKASGESPD